MRCDAFTAFALCLPTRNASLPIFEWIPMSVVVCVYVHHNMSRRSGRFAFDIIFTCSGSSVQSVPKIFEASACRAPFHIRTPTVRFSHKMCATCMLIIPYPIVFMLYSLCWIRRFTLQMSQSNFLSNNNLPPCNIIA